MCVVKPLVLCFLVYVMGSEAFMFGGSSGDICTSSNHIEFHAVETSMVIVLFQPSLA
jgi:hypothetical protein